MNLRNRASKSFLWTGVEHIGAQGISFVISVIIARLLFPEDFGLIGMLVVFTAIANILVDCGMSHSIIRTQHADKLDYASVFRFNVAVALLLYALLFFTAPLIARFYETETLTVLLRWYALIVVANALGIVQKARLVRSLQFKRLLKLTLPSILMGGSTGIAMAYYGFGVWSLVGSGLVQASSFALLLWVFVKPVNVLRFSTDKIKQHLRFGYKLMLSSLLDSVYLNSYNVVIGKGFSAQNLGYFTRANSFKQAPAHNMGTMVNKVTLPLFAKIQDDDKTLKRAYKKTVRFIVFAMAPLMFFAAAVAEPLFELLLTEKWVPAAAYFQILFIVAIVYPLNAFNLNILKVKGRSDIFLRLEIYKKAMAVVILAVAFQFGMYGLLWAMVAITLLGFTINSHHSGKFVNYPLAQQMRDILPFILIAGAVAVMVRIFDGTFGTRIPYGFLRVLAGLSVGAVLYFPIIRYTNPELMGEITHFFKRKK